jgi:hypothetical protein
MGLVFFIIMGIAWVLDSVYTITGSHLGFLIQLLVIIVVIITGNSPQKRIYGPIVQRTQNTASGPPILKSLAET